MRTVTEDKGGARKGAGESAAHRELKRLGRAWLKERGCRATATEVRLPLSPYRVDVAGYRAVPTMGVWGDTFALECKASRADFSRDAGLEEAARAESRKLAEERRRLTALLATHLPDCAQGVSLFGEFDEYDFSDLRHDRWRRLVARCDLLERRLQDGVKFSRIVRYASASFCYLVVEPNVLRGEHEIPIGWGCLERDGEQLRLLREARRLRCRDEAKLVYLERIAARGGR
ncbi:hypothetical protein [Pelagicoccus sp. SDUM812003]|uniref:hypothetical protein n=1 Tax=Pelagicoccus sp. SDUM812003 TaxID=3041267 RepID=UPI00280D89ED|nr:hypothetical protein [Pelagicoccus sp. SDUM812003]MDQ8201722.1 hypothetical protein [Pelagicoccus sp. SDUM812003]